MLNGRVIATLMVLVVVEVGLLRAQARWVPYRHWGFSVRGTSLDTRASAHYASDLALITPHTRQPHLLSSTVAGSSTSHQHHMFTLL